MSFKINKELANQFQKLFLKVIKSINRENLKTLHSETCLQISRKLQSIPIIIKDPWTIERIHD